jgi:hypothetical protein
MISYLDLNLLTWINVSAYARSRQLKMFNGKRALGIAEVPILIHIASIALVAVKTRRVPCEAIYSSGGPTDEDCLVLVVRV